MGAGRPLAHAVLIAGLGAAALGGCSDRARPLPSAGAEQAAPTAGETGEEGTPVRREAGAREGATGEADAAPDPVAEGARLARVLGCSMCHSTDGSAATGPSWQGLFGQERASADGTMEVVDTSFLRRSILEPQASVRQGYPPVMPAFRDMLAGEDIAALIAYIESLR